MILQDIIPACAQIVPEFLTRPEADEAFNVINDLSEWRRLVDFFDVRRDIPSTVFLDYKATSKNFTLKSTGGSPSPWSNTLLMIKERLDALFEANFSSLLINYYLDGDEGLPLHTDNIVPQGSDPIVAGVSLGAVRSFQFVSKVNAQETVSIDLPHGSLIVLREQCQRDWLHSVPPMPVIAEPRINLTFRSMRSK